MDIKFKIYFIISIFILQQTNLILSILSSSLLGNENIKSINDNNDKYSKRNRIIRAAPSTDLNKRWPKGQVFYKIDKKLPGNLKVKIRNAMKKIEKVTCIRYILRTYQKDYVRFHYNETNCFEPVGRQGGGVQNVDIHPSDPDCSVYGFFLHSLMQTLGFYHEHQRYDRDEYITIYENNIEPEKLFLFKKLNATSHFYSSTYDTESIMHYGSFHYSLNGKPTILKKNGGLIKDYMDKNELSSLDILGINEYYNCP